MAPREGVFWPCRFAGICFQAKRGRSPQAGGLHRDKAPASAPFRHVGRPCPQRKQQPAQQGMGFKGPAFAPKSASWIPGTGSVVEKRRKLHCVVDALTSQCLLRVRTTHRSRNSEHGAKTGAGSRCKKGNLARNRRNSAGDAGLVLWNECASKKEKASFCDRNSASADTNVMLFAVLRALPGTVGMV